jgi:hypothetical protein
MRSEIWALYQTDRNPVKSGEIRKGGAMEEFLEAQQLEVRKENGGFVVRMTPEMFFRFFDQLLGGSLVITAELPDNPRKKRIGRPPKDQSESPS